MSTPYNRTNNIRAIVIHHMGDGLSPSVSILKRWNPHGYDYPEYDFGIEADGTIRQGRPLNYQGAHCLSDKPPYCNYGDQWWNKNSIGIGLAGDFTKYSMPQAQFDALVKLVKQLMQQYNLTLDNVFPHGQVTYTSCPGCIYSKVPALTGGWNYDTFENAVKNNNQGDEFQMDCCVVYFTPADYSNALIIANLNGGCACYCRNGSNTSIHQDIEKSKKVFVIGGGKINHPNAIYLSGNTAKDTLIEVAKYLG